MRILLIAAVLAAGLAGCGKKPHSTCVDAESATAYGVAWQRALAAAREAGKVDVAKAVATQGKAFSNFGLLKNGKYADWCHFIDGVRRDAGF